MSPRMRIGIHRAAFLLLCPLPTLLLVSWIAHGASQRVAAVDKSLWEEELSWLFGLEVRVQRVEQPQRGRTVLHGVQISDPEWGQLAYVRALELARTEQGLEIAASQPEVQADRLERLCEVLHDRVLRTRQPTDLAIHFQAESMTFVSPARDAQDASHAETVKDVEAWITSSEAGPQLSADFRRADLPDAQAVQVRVVRKNRLETVPSTTWSIDTQPDAELPTAPLPCWVLSRALPALAPLGEACQFEGRCWGERTPRGWQGEINGIFREVDLYRLVTQRYPHLLSGRADMQLSAVVRDGRLEEASGALVSGGGTIGRDFVHALVGQLPLKLSDTAIPPTDKNWRYRQLAIGFDVTRDGLRTWGLCDSKGDAVLTDARGPLVERIPGTRAPILGLVRALVPSSTTEVPATRETEPLLSVLPIPSVTPPSSDKGIAPRATLRPD